MIARRLLLPLIGRYAALTMLAVVIMVPFVNMLSTALTGEKELYLNPGRMLWIPESLRLDNFVRAMTYPGANFLRAFRNTLFIIAVNITMYIVSSSWIAYGFARVRFRGRRALFLFMLSTMMIPSQVTMIPLYIFFSKLHWVNTFMPMLIFSFFGAPFYIFLIRQFIRGIPDELFDAARIDGCNHYRMYWRITLPQLVPVLTAIGVFKFIGEWNALMVPLIYLRKRELATIALELSHLQGMVTQELSAVPLTNIVMAASLVTMIPPTLIFVLGQKHFLKGVDISTGLKG